MTTTTQLSWIAIDKVTGEIITDSKTTRAVTMHQQIFEALATICKMLPGRDANGAYQWRMMTRTERGMLNRASKELNQIEATPDEISDFLEWFKKNDWRGKRGDPPLPTDVVKMFTRSRQCEKSEPNIANKWLKVLRNE